MRLLFLESEDSRIGPSRGLHARGIGGVEPGRTGLLPRSTSQWHWVHPPQLLQQRWIPEFGGLRRGNGASHPLSLPVSIAHAKDRAYYWERLLLAAGHVR